MQLEHTILGFETAVENQLRVAGPDAAEIGGHLMAALKPAIRQSLMDVVNMAEPPPTPEIPSTASWSRPCEERRNPAKVA